MATPVPPRPFATFAEQDARCVRGDYAVIRVDGVEVFLHRRLVGQIAGAFARHDNGLPPFAALGILDEEPLRPA